MTKKVIKALLLLGVLSSCEKIGNEDYQPFLYERIKKIIKVDGANTTFYLASFMHTDLAFVNADKSAYSLRMRQNVHLIDGGPDIKETGFNINYSSTDGVWDVKTIPATISRNGDDMYFEAILECSYGSRYNIIPYVVIDQLMFEAEASSFYRNLEDMLPNGNNMVTDVEMRVNAHTITAVVETEEQIDGIDFSFAGISHQATKNGIRYTADFDLNELDPGNFSTFYSGISFAAKNKFGEYSGKIDYSVGVYQPGNGRYVVDTSNDGIHENYITIAGVNWAKGNLIYKDGRWMIDGNPFSHSPYLQEENMVQYFSYGSTSATIDAYPNSTTISSMPWCISGDKNYDVATANLGNGWKLPTWDEAYKLDANASQQCTKNGMIYYSPQKLKKRFHSCSPVTITSVPSDGLFLPCGGFYESLRTGKPATLTNEGIGVYMTEGHDYDNISKKYLLNCLYFYLQYHSMNQYYITFIGSQYSSKEGMAYWDGGEFNIDKSKYYVRPVYSPN